MLLFNSCDKNDGIQIEVVKGTIINSITIISANEEKVESYIGYVVLDQERIVFAGKEKPVLSGDFVEIAGDGKYIISGLIDSHVHLANTAGFNGKLKNKYPELLEAYFEQLPKSYLYHGFTTLVDVNNYAPELIDQIKKSEPCPDIFTCGNQVQIMDDFNMEMEEYSTEYRYQSNFLYDRYNLDIDFPDSINLAKHSPQKIINEIKKENGIGVKLVYEDEASGLAVSWAKPSLNIMKDLVQEASNEDLPVLLHAPSLEGHQMGVNAGVDIFAHGLWNWTSNFEKEFNNLELTKEHKGVLLKIAEKQLGYQMTFRTIIGEEDLILGNFKTDQNLIHVYPKKYLKILKTEEGLWGKDKILNRAAFLKETNPPFYEAIKSNHQDNIKMWLAVYDLYKSRLNVVAKFLSEQNANFILGSDTPAMNMFTNPPGYNGLLEMKHMYEAGISLEQIFRAATYNNAKSFHLDTHYGNIENDKIANLLILKSNPLQDINAYNNIETVIIRGELVSRNELSATKN